MLFISSKKLFSFLSLRQIIDYFIKQYYKIAPQNNFIKTTETSISNDVINDETPISNDVINDDLAASALF